MLSVATVDLSELGTTTVALEELDAAVADKLLTVLLFAALDAWFDESFVADEPDLLYVT